MKVKIDAWISPDLAAQLTAQANAINRPRSYLIASILERSVAESPPQEISLGAIAAMIEAAVKPLRAELRALQTPTHGEEHPAQARPGGDESAPQKAASPHPAPRHREADSPLLLSALQLLASHFAQGTEPTPGQIAEALSIRPEKVGLLLKRVGIESSGSKPRKYRRELAGQVEELLKKESPALTPTA